MATSRNESHSAGQKTTDGYGVWLLISGLKCLGHLLAVTTIVAIISYPYLSNAFWRAAGHMSRDGILWETISWGLAGQFGIAGLIWGFVYFLGSRMLSKTDQVRQKPKSLASSAGTVMTETVIIIIPVVFLIMSLAQLAVNNIAGVLMEVAAYQANRTAWTLEPDLADGDGEGGAGGEKDNSASYLRGDRVDENYIEEMARIQAAMVLTPVAPGGYGVPPGNTSPQARAARGMLVGSQIPVPFDDMGRMGKGLADQTIAFQQDQGAIRKTFTRALDTSPYIVRSSRKFTFAYMCTRVELEVDNGGGVDGCQGVGRRECVSTYLQYNQFNAFPLVNRIFPNTAFGQEGSVQGVEEGGDEAPFMKDQIIDADVNGPNTGFEAPLSGYYTVFEAVRTRQTQIETSLTWPQSMNPESTF
jgi:hypothetical protein